MHFETAVDIAADPETVWRHLIDFERWPEMTASVTRAERLDDGPLGPGSRVLIHQPRLAPATWTVTEFTAGGSFTWESRAPGVVTTGGHIVTAGPAGTTARLTLTQRGPAAPLIGLLYGRLSRRYVTMEAAGLKRLAES
ncbi:SRPBCC family protein [Spirillospora sp. NPDC029432]|uniref:SRPBCC family protein n=1 Tax=Spirillospora sp. NPDC029432 TaxID=3154599 RepID=UPI003455EC0B